MARETLELYPGLIEYWAEHGAEIRQQNPGKFLVLVAGSEPEAEYYTDREKAIAKARELGVKALYIPIPAVGGEHVPEIFD